MFFPLPSPLRFFFGSFLAHLPFVFPLSSEPIFYNPKFYNDMARPGLKGTRRVPKDRAQTGRVGSPPSAVYARMPAPPAPPGYPGVPRGTRGLGNVRHMFRRRFWRAIWPLYTATILAFCLACVLTFLVTFYLAHILTTFLTYGLAWHFFYLYSTYPDILF